MREMRPLLQPSKGPKNGFNGSSSSFDTQNNIVFFFFL